MIPSSRILSTRRGRLTVAIGFVLSCSLLGAGRAAADDVPDELPSGLIATYRGAAGAGDVSIMRIEPTPHFWLKSNESPHPRLDARTWSGRWEGQIQVLRAAKYRLSADVGGRATVSIGGRVVLSAEAKAEATELAAGPEVQLEAGEHRFVVEFSKTDCPARLRLFWESPQFRREPISWMLLRHRAEDEAVPRLVQSRLEDRGRFLAEELSCVACHRPDDADKLAKGLATRQGPDLSRIGDRAFAGWLFAWLDDAQAFRAQAVMPRMFANDETGRIERFAVARYLASLGGPLQPPRNEPKADERKNFVRRGERVFGRVGCTVCHAAPEGKRPFAELAHLGSKSTPDKLAQYLQNPLAVDPSGRMPHMMLDGGEARDLGFFLCESKHDDIEQKLPEPPDAAAVLALFRRLAPSAKELETFENSRRTAACSRSASGL